MMLAYNPFAELDKMQREFDRVLNSEVTSRWTPAIELQETPTATSSERFSPVWIVKHLTLKRLRKLLQFRVKPTVPSWMKVTNIFTPNSPQASFVGL